VTHTRTRRNPGASGQPASVRSGFVANPYPPLNLAVRTPRLVLHATNELLERLVPVVRAGVVDSAAPLPSGDPMSL
jgi:hypothetical protein